MSKDEPAGRVRKGPPRQDLAPSVTASTYTAPLKNPVVGTAVR